MDTPDRTSGDDGRGARPLRSAHAIGRACGRATDLAALDAAVAQCYACPRLVAWRQEVAATKRAAYADETYWGRAVPGFGDPAARLLVVGLAPAAHGANRTGRMFTGDRSGDWLFAALWRTGLANQPHSVHGDDGMRLRGVRVSAPVHCAPPDNVPRPDERDRCAPYLAREVDLLEDLRVVVALGRFAYDAVSRLFGVRPRPRFAHGCEVVAPDGPLVICSYHVSQQNTFTGRLTEPMLDAVLERAADAAGLRAGP
jgi:uracil-DNA glycosylase